MHELSIAMSLVDAVCDALPSIGDRVVVRGVRVKVGSLSGVVPEALRFSFDLAASGSPIEGAHLQIEQADASRELQLVALEVIDDPADRGSPPQHPQEE